MTGVRRSGRQEGPDTVIDTAICYPPFHGDCPPEVPSAVVGAPGHRAGPVPASVPRAVPVTARRGSVRHDIELRCPPDRIWALVGDPVRIHEWFPGIESCTVEGDLRTVVTRSGLPMPEQLLTIDHVLRRFQYRITAPMFKEHLGTVDVHDLHDGTSLVVYSTDADPAPLALVIGGAARNGPRNCP